MLYGKIKRDRGDNSNNVCMFLVGLCMCFLNLSASESVLSRTPVKQFEAYPELASK